MNLLSHYDEAVAFGGIENDPAQRIVLAHLQTIADRLKPTKFRWFQRKSATSHSGLYLCGPVGGGKTFLMDLFYEKVGIKQKSRFHFHRFMQRIDAELRRLQGQKNPLQRIAADFAKNNRLLCLDEFLVHDIADAMILAELLRALFAHNIVLVATSNTKPDDLYLNGLQRARFLPAIQLIKEQCELLTLVERRDYRLGRTPLFKAYLYPLNAAARECMQQQFASIADVIVENESLIVQNRSISCVQYSEGAVWFRFDAICNVPRSQLDYLEIASRFKTVFLSDVPRLRPDETVKALLFIHFIDVMYDKRVRVIISAEAPADDIYQEGPMATQFKRTLSRLHEMQSVDYLQHSSHSS